MRLGEDSRDFGRGFMRICDTLGEDLQGFARDFGRGLTRICDTLGEDSLGFKRLLGEDS